jgi:hypothetical protein
MRVHPSPKHLRQPRNLTPRPGALALLVLVATLPLLVPAILIAIRHPSIAWTGDRALTELAVREAAHFHQLVGMGARFGWRHPGPLWVQLLVPFYELSGHAPWSLAVGALTLHIACVVIAVVIAGRAGGRLGGAVMTALIAIYIAATGLTYWTNLWAGYAYTWPLLALTVDGAVAASDVEAGWSVPLALLIGSLLIQTDVAMTVPVVVIGATALGLRAFRLGWRRLVSPYLGLVVLVWIPPIIQQFEFNPGNLTLLWRYAVAGGGGYSLRTALAVVGAALSVVPLGARWVLDNGVQQRLGAGPWWAVIWTLAFIAANVAVVVVARRRRRRFAADLATVTLAATIAAVVTISRVTGEINYYLLTWISILPVAGLAAAVLALAPWRHGSPVVRAALAVAAVLVAFLVLTQGGTQDWDRIDAAAVATQTARVEAAVGVPTLVRIHIVTSDAWPDAAGVAVQLERRGASVEVDSDWVFLFGDAFRPRRLPTVELWFARAHELPAVTSEPGAVELGSAGGVDVLGRADVLPTPNP